jgi:hypothetical protein
MSAAVADPPASDTDTQAASSAGHARFIRTTVDLRERGIVALGDGARGRDARDGRTAVEMKRMSGGSLRAAGYDERSHRLVVELTAGTFEYTGVTPEVWRRFSTASSPWSYYRDNIEEEYPAKRTR